MTFDEWYNYMAGIVDLTLARETKLHNLLKRAYIEGMQEGCKNTLELVGSMTLLEERLETDVTDRLAPRLAKVVQEKIEEYI